MDFDTFHYLSDFYKPLAIVFKPFSATHVAFSDLTKLLTDNNIILTKRVLYHAPNANSPLDTVEVYLGNLSKTHLQNFAGFVYYNGLEPINAATMIYAYDVVVAIGRNRQSTAVVDIPVSMFPWSSPLFSIRDTPDVLLRPPPCSLLSTHKMIRSCHRCTAHNRGCVPTPGRLSCIQCKPGECMPSSGENVARSREFHATIMNTAYALSPAYQYLLHTVKKAANCSKKPILSNKDRTLLLAMVREDCNGISDYGSEAAIHEHCKSVQSVYFANGKLEILFEKDMENLYGFQDTPAIASATPHLGFATPDSVRNLLDAALSSIGTMVYIEESIWMRDGQFKPSRVFCVAGMMMHCDVSFVIGWNY